jgi:hypothetical protein
MHVRDWRCLRRLVSLSPWKSKLSTRWSLERSKTLQKSWIRHSYGEAHANHDRRRPRFVYQSRRLQEQSTGGHHNCPNAPTARQVGSLLQCWSPRLPVLYSTKITRLQSTWWTRLVYWTFLAHRWLRSRWYGDVNRTYPWCQPAQRSLQINHSVGFSPLHSPHYMQLDRATDWTTARCLPLTFEDSIADPGPLLQSILSNFRRVKLSVTLLRELMR